MADTAKLNLLGEGGGGLEEKLGTQKISVLDHMNVFNYTGEKSDSFVIDMEGLPNGSTVSKDPVLEQSPRSALQRSLSRKASGQRTNNNPPADRDSLVPSPRDTNETSIPLACVQTCPTGSSTTKKDTPTTATRTTDPSTNQQQVHHQITITTSNTNSSTEGRCTVRRNSFKRYPPTWVLHPKRVHFFFATLSSMGTLLLIYFTLSMGRMIKHENGLD